MTKPGIPFHPCICEYGVLVWKSADTFLIGTTQTRLKARYWKVYCEFCDKEHAIFLCTNRAQARRAWKEHRTKLLAQTPNKTELAP